MGEGVLHPLAALIVEAKDLVIGISKGAHLHRTPLAHAHAVAIPPGIQHKTAAGLLHRP